MYYYTSIMKHDIFFNELVQTLINIDDESLMEDFLVGILTPKEREEIPVRLQIVKDLKRGIPQREIADNLKVGVATVSRGSREIKKGRFKVIKVNKQSL
jgi:TrpR family transcriptional regulator, trp operon repressor